MSPQDQQLDVSGFVLARDQRCRLASGHCSSLLLNTIRRTYSFRGYITHAKFLGSKCDLYEKDVPQPQDFFALGFWKTKP